MQETIVCYIEVVFIRFVAWIFDISDFDARLFGDHLGQIANTVRFSHLVKNLHAVSFCRWVFKRQSNAAASILDVYERTGLASSAMYGKRIINSSLHQKAIQNGAVITIVVKPVD